MTEQPDWNEMIIADEAKQEKARRKRKRRSCCLAVLIAPLCLILVVLDGLSIYSKYFLFYFIRGDEVLGVYPSPTGNYTVTTYLLPGAGITVGESVLGVLTDHQTDRSKNIYYDHRNSSNVFWENEVTVVINGEILDVRTDIYDYSRKIGTAAPPLSNAMLDSGVF